MLKLKFDVDSLNSVLNDSNIEFKKRVKLTARKWENLVREDTALLEQFNFVLEGDDLVVRADHTLPVDYWLHSTQVELINSFL